MHMKLSKAQFIATSVTVGVVGLSLLTNVAVGQGLSNPNIPGVTTVGRVSTVGSLVDTVRFIVRWVYIIFFVIAVLMILFAAFTYLTAAGNEEKVKKARDSIIYAAVAVAVALLAVGFEQIIRTFLEAPTA